MEMSHRSKEFTKIIEEAEEILRNIMNIPEDYSVIFLQGGASLQFAMVPMNLSIEGKNADIVLTGSWSKKAHKEMKKITNANVAGSSEDKNFSYIPQKLDLSPDASYVHITSNNTIFGTQYKSLPDTGNTPLVADMSSDILCCPIDVKRFGMIYAGAQKNIGPSGVGLIIIRKDLIERGDENLPTFMQYRTHAEGKSLFHTPPTFAIYIINLVLKWIEKKGGLKEIQKMNQQKADLLYSAIDQSDLYRSPVTKEDRSNMNVVFRVNNDEELEKKFIAAATEKDLIGLKGHRSVGGLRASIYNAHPYEGVEALVQFMKEFESQV